MESSALPVIFFGLTLVSNVAAATNPDIVGMAVAGCLSFILLSVVVTIIIVSFQWTDWFNHWMRLRGKIRMPRSYFKKKEESKRKLLSASANTRLSELNGYAPNQNIYESVNNVDNWPNRGRHLPSQRVYEEKDAVVQFGAEDDDDVNEVGSNVFTIETEILDSNLAERVDSTKRDKPDTVSITDLNPYSEVHPTRLSNSLEINTASQAQSSDPHSANKSPADDSEIKVTSFNDAFIHL